MPHPQKELAIQLRREGKTYSEIRAIVPVAKSTLTEWFKSVQLAESQKQNITQKRIAAQLRGAAKQHQKRITELDSLRQKGKEEIGTITDRELWLLGIALYWAEGSKQNTRSISAGIMFGNSDINMIRLFIKWLENLRIPENEIYYELYVHKSRESDILTFRRWWSKGLDIPLEKISRVYLKNGNPKTRRSNVGDLYHGLLRIKVRSSTSLNRQVNGWIHGITNSCGIV